MRSKPHSYDLTYALTEGRSCPTCSAESGKPCRSAAGNRLPGPHIARYRMAVRAFLAARKAAE